MKLTESRRIKKKGKTKKCGQHSKGFRFPDFAETIRKNKMNMKDILPTFY